MNVYIRYFSEKVNDSIQEKKNNKVYLVKNPLIQLHENSWRCMVMNQWINVTPIPGSQSKIIGSFHYYIFNGSRNMCTRGCTHYAPHGWQEFHLGVKPILYILYKPKNISWTHESLPWPWQIDLDSFLNFLLMYLCMITTCISQHLQVHMFQFYLMFRQRMSGNLMNLGDTKLYSNIHTFKQRWERLALPD